MSPSSAESTSSALTFGSVRSIGMAQPSGALAALAVPGSSWTIMSFSPVFGRRSAVAFSWIGVYFLRSFIVICAWPLTRSTAEISPTSTPAIWTVCPWPGVTDCAVEKFAL